MYSTLYKSGVDTVPTLQIPQLNKSYTRLATI